MGNKKFYTIDSNGESEIRDLEREERFFTWEKYQNGELDAYNYQWHENFNNYIYDDLGCDYERYGCYIKPNDVVLDIGANIGVFSHRAEIRGASKVIAFEPMSLTFECLSKNKGNKTVVYKNAVGGKYGFKEFSIHTSFNNLGGVTNNEQDKKMFSNKTIHTENVFVVNINDIFKSYNNEINFMKIDIEGGEVEVLNNITDDNLKSLRCLSAEFHKTYEEFDSFQDKFIHRMEKLGFKCFTVYHGDGNLRTLNLWKK